MKYSMVLVAGMAAVLSPVPAMANDSVAEIGAGGLVLGRSSAVAIEEETLYLSMDKVEVDYVFRNQTGEDVVTIVAFPMPDIRTDPFGGDWAIPKEDDNFLGFTVEAGGRTIEPQLAQRASALGVDVTGKVLDAGFEIAPQVEPGEPLDVSALSDAQIEDMAAWGIVDAYKNPDTGTFDEVWPTWTLETAYWWPMTFPAGQAVDVHHTYTPATGGSAGLFFFRDMEMTDVDPVYVDKYCMDDAFLNAVRKRQKESLAAGSYGYTERRLSYVLTTGANWAGSIGHLRIIVDKGAPENLVSFCGTGVTKTGPTTFEMEMTDFWPERDIDILIAVAPEQ